MNTSSSSSNQNAGLKVASFIFHLLGKIISWFFFPALVITVSVIVQSKTENAVATVIASFAVLVIYTILLEKNDSDNYAAKVLRSVLTAVSAITVWFVLLHHVDVPTNPWGPIGWALLISALVIVIILLFLKEVNESSFEQAFEEPGLYSSSLFTCTIVVMISYIYLLWGTQYIWIPLVAIGILFVIIANSIERKYNGDKESREQLLWTALIVQVLGFVSTICQFWFYQIVFGYQLWQLLLNLVIILAVIAAFILFVWFVVTNQKRNRAKEAKRKDDEKKAEEQRITNEKSEALKDAKKKSMIELRSSVEKSDAPTWKDIITLSNYGYNDISYEIIAKAKCVEILNTSQVKNKIAWNASHFEFVFKKIDEVFDKCYDDIIIKKLIEQVQSLGGFSTYESYDALRRQILNYSHIKALVTLKEADKPSE